MTNTRDDFRILATDEDRVRREADRGALHPADVVAVHAPADVLVDLANGRTPRALTDDEAKRLARARSAGIRARFKLYRHGREVEGIDRRPDVQRKPTKPPAFLPDERVVALDTESTWRGGRYVVDLVQLAAAPGLVDGADTDGVRVFDLDDGDPVADMLAALVAAFGAPVDGKGAPPKGALVACAFYNLVHDVGCMFRDREALRRILAGARNARTVHGSIEVVWETFVDQSAAQFTWRVANHATRRGVRVRGVDLMRHFKPGTSLAKALQSYKLAGKGDLDPVVHEKAYDATPCADGVRRPVMTPADRADRLAYAARDASQTRALYLALRNAIVASEPRALRSDGTLPASAASVAGRVMWLRSFDTTDAWTLPPVEVDQLAARAYHGGRTFVALPGVQSATHGMRARVVVLDKKSAYPATQCLVPCPTRAAYLRVDAHAVPSSDAFVARWRGRWGVLDVSGEALDPIYPALRVPAEGGRLRYVVGRFERIPVTVPELVIGVLRGALRVDRVHGGVEVEDTSPGASTMFQRFIFEAFEEKETYAKDPRGEAAKIRANSGYGKLVECTPDVTMWEERVFLPAFGDLDRNHRGRIAKSVLSIFATGAADVACTCRVATGDDVNAEHAKSCALFRLWLGGPDEAPYVARLFYAALVDMRRNPPPTDRYADEVVNAYALALWDILGEDTSPEYQELSEFLLDARTWRVGDRFMATYAALVTGLMSAELGAMAFCTRALAGDTDAVHVHCPTGRVEDIPGFQRPRETNDLDHELPRWRGESHVPDYFSLMREAGYLAPREGGDTIGRTRATETLGRWGLETTEPATEAVYAAIKRYSLRLGEGEGATYKQATHALVRFTTPEVEDERRRRDFDTTGDEWVKAERELRERGEDSSARAVRWALIQRREASARALREEHTHALIRCMVDPTAEPPPGIERDAADGVPQVRYTSRAAPKKPRATLREKSGEPGAWASHELSVRNMPTPNTDATPVPDGRTWTRWHAGRTWTDARGRVHFDEAETGRHSVATKPRKARREDDAAMLAAVFGVKPARAAALPPRTKPMGRDARTGHARKRAR